MFIVPARKCLPDNGAPSGQVSAAIHLQIDQNYRVISFAVRRHPRSVDSPSPRLGHFPSPSRAVAQEP